jgi:hypothetical protein
MKRTLNARSVTRSLMGLFAHPKGVNPRILYGDTYYKQIFFTKQMFDGIELVSKIEKISKKQAAHLRLA